MTSSTAKTHLTEQIDKIAASIAEPGWDPVIALGQIGRVGVVGPTQWQQRKPRQSPGPHGEPAPARKGEAVVNPRQVRDFARAKTDRLDAAAIARFAATVRPTPRALPDAARRELIDLIARRRQLVSKRAAERIRRHQLAPRLQPRLDEHLAWLAMAIAELDRDLSVAVRRSSLWRVDDQLLASVPGVGPITRATLLAMLSELGSLTRRQIAALVGVAPMNRDSGTWRGQRFVRGGRADVRSVLYMATVAALRCNSVIRDFHQRLIQAGKPAKVALTACMRKLPTLLNIIARTRQPWQAT